MRPIPEALWAGPFTAATAGRFGVTPRQLQGQRFRRLLYGVYVVREVEVTLPILAIAVSLILPAGTVLAGSSAALFQGADVRRRGDLGIDVTMLRGAVIRRAGIRATAAYLEQGDVVEVMGIPMTSPVRTAFDLARQRDLIDRVVGIDAMLNRGGCSLEELTGYVADRPEWRGIRWAREAVTWAEPLSESPMETKQRMHFILGGLPRPVAQYSLTDAAGLVVARLDHAYVKWRVGPEWDGEPHSDRWRQDNERQQRIWALDWWHRRYTSVSVQEGWDAMVKEVGKALYARGWRP